MKIPGLRSFAFFCLSTLLLSSSPAHSGDFKGVMRGLGETLQDIGEERSRQQHMEKMHELERQRVIEEQKIRLEADEQRKRIEAVEQKRNAVSTGSGFFVDLNGHLITNAHVVAERKYLAIKDIEGKFYKAKILDMDSQRDLALLQVDGKFPSLRVADSKKVKKGQHVWAVGYPQISIQGNESKVTDGIINSYTGIKGNTNWFQISVPIQGGNSGGPLVDENSNVIGVIVARLNDKTIYSMTESLPQNVNYAIKSSVLLEFLSEKGIKNTYKRNEENSIAYVDRSTVLVIAKNQPLGYIYELPPVDVQQEDSTLTHLHPDWRTISNSMEFKKWLQSQPFDSDRENFNSPLANKRSTVFQEYKDHLEGLKIQTEHEATEKLRIQKLAQRDRAVAETHHDWQELKESSKFSDWLSKWPAHQKIIEKSLEEKEVLSVVDAFEQDQRVALIKVGKVTSVSMAYGYLVFTIDPQQSRNIGTIYLVSKTNGLKIKGAIEKVIGTDVSASFRKEDLLAVQYGDPVYARR